SVVPDAAGWYRLPALPAGEYEVRVVPTRARTGTGSEPGANLGAWLGAVLARPDAQELAQFRREWILIEPSGRHRLDIDLGSGEPPLGAIAAVLHGDVRVTGMAPEDLHVRVEQEHRTERITIGKDG